MSEKESSIVWTFPTIYDMIVYEMKFIRLHQNTYDVLPKNIINISIDKNI